MARPAEDIPLTVTVPQSRCPVEIGVNYKRQNLQSSMISFGRFEVMRVRDAWSTPASPGSLDRARCGGLGAHDLFGRGPGRFGLGGEGPVSAIHPLSQVKFIPSSQSQARGRVTDGEARTRSRLGTPPRPAVREAAGTASPVRTARPGPLGPSAIYTSPAYKLRLRVMSESTLAMSEFSVHRVASLQVASKFKKLVRAHRRAPRPRPVPRWRRGVGAP